MSSSPSQRYVLQLMWDTESSHFCCNAFLGWCPRFLQQIYSIGCDSGVYTNHRKAEQTIKTQAETGDVFAPELPLRKKTGLRSTMLTSKPKEVKSQKKKKKDVIKRAFVSSAASKGTMRRGVTRKRTAITNEALVLHSNET